MLVIIPHQKLVSFYHLPTRGRAGIKHGDVWYVSILCIIFDCFMPIYYKFPILLATFYTIFGTNILIQCPVPVPICCMFFVSQKIHIKRSPNGIKTDGDFFGIYVNFGKWNQCETMPEGPTRVRGAPQGVRRALGARGHSVRWLVPFFFRKKPNIRIKIVSKFQPNRSYGSPGI